MTARATQRNPVVKKLKKQINFKKCLNNLKGRRQGSILEVAHIITCTYMINIYTQRRLFKIGK